MLGRAGRPSYHDIGKVYLLPEVGRQFEDENEEMVAVDLLDSEVDAINVDYSEDDVVEQYLADICAGRVKNTSQLRSAYKKVDLPLDFDSAYGIVLNYGLVKEVNELLKPTRFGRAVCVSFLHHDDAEYIRKRMVKMNPVEITVNLEPFENAYLSQRLSTHLSRVLKINLSSRLFADSTLDILSNSSYLANMDPAFQEKVITLQLEFFSCKCKDKPFCTCFQSELSRRIIKYRMQKRDPVDISRRLLKDFEIHAYAGDIFSWLDSVIRMLEAVQKIAYAFNRKKVVLECNRLIKEIEN
jgi:helicase